MAIFNNLGKSTDIVEGRQAGGPPREGEGGRVSVNPRILEVEAFFIQFKSEGKFT